MNAVRFNINKPTTIDHARALTLKAMGEETMESVASMIEYDNEKGFDLMPEDGVMLISASSNDSQADVKIEFDSESINSVESWTAPGAEGIPFEKFSYQKLVEGGQYRFVIDGLSQRVQVNDNGTVTALLRD